MNLFLVAIWRFVDAKHLLTWSKSSLYCNRNLPRQVLTDLFTTTILVSYKQEIRRKKLKHKVFQKILEDEDKEFWVSVLMRIWCTFSSLSGREGCLAEVLFLSHEDLHSCNATLDKQKITGTYNQRRICAQGWI